MRHRRTIMTILLAVLTTAVTGVAGPSPAQAAISCAADSSNGSTWYDGPSAGYVYDPPFYPTNYYLTWLGTHTPQGVATWPNWNGTGSDLLLVTSYRDDDYTYLQSINPATGANLPGLQLAGFHAGGIAVVGGWVYISAGTEIRRYRTSALRAALESGGGYVVMEDYQYVEAASFLGSYGGYVFAGKFDSAARGWMHQYRVESDGSLTRVGSGWQVPTKTQGVIVTGTHFVFSTSYGRQNRSNIYSVRRGTYTDNLDNATLYCFRAPSMSEGMTQWNGSAYVVYESASHLYASDPTTRNVIPNMHRVSMSWLTSRV